jgi:transcriptional regulator with XRE-family HTH domain
MPRSPSERSTKTGSQTLGRLVRERRASLGMTRQHLADATGVPYPTIAQIETAYRSASPSRLGVIARALGLDPAELYEALLNDTATSARTARSARSAEPTARRPGHQDWLPNPAYRPQPAPMPNGPAPLAMEGPPPPPDVVEQVVALLADLPADQRLDALSRVQSRLLAGLVHEEVRRATNPQRRS